MMMKGGKDDKIMGTLFPRLHVNDTTERGDGPRAPPRNKMALYEHVNIPTHQRSIQPNNATTTLVPLASSSQGGAHERPLFSPFYIPPPTTAHSVDHKLHSRSSKRTYLNTASCSKVVPGNGILKTSTTTNSSSMQLRGAHDKHLKRTNTTYLTSRNHGRNHGEEYLKESVLDKEMQKLVSNSSAKENTAEPLEHTHASLNQEYRIQVEKGNLLRVNRKSSSRASLENDHGNPSEAGDCFGNIYCQDKAQSSLQVREVGRNDDDVSEISMVDSMSDLDISHDDLVGAIGQKDFGIARRAIVDQQRLFSEQVFELHRVIKVQKLIAGSPHLLFQGNSYLSKDSLKQVSPVKKLPSGYAVKSGSQIKAEDDTQNPNHSLESRKNAIEYCPVSSPNKDVDTARLAQLSSYRLHSGYQLPPPVSAENKTSPWWFQPPPGNQWLVPIMSPSEGLVYKPCIGAFPSTAEFMAPIYGDWDPMTLPPVAAYGFPASNQQRVAVLSGISSVSQANLPNSGKPIVDPINRASNCLPQCQAERLSEEDVNYNRTSGSQHNMLNKKTEVVSCARKTQTSRDSELTENAVSNEQAADGRFSDRGDIPVLFQVVPPSMKASDRPSRTENSAPLVIKVIPHNPRTATESAARIFQCIQAERRQYDGKR